jgi:AcrR family transcriptional regulator
MSYSNASGKSHRKYDAPRRQQHAATTRAAILDAATRLFASQGYGLTTMGAIAAEAGVAPKSVHAVGEKHRLLLLAVDRAIVGDDAPGPMREGAEFRVAEQTPDPYEQCRQAAALGASVLFRLYPIYRAFEQAAAADDRLMPHWQEYQQRRLSDVRQLVSAITSHGPLRPGLSADDAADALWSILTWHTVALLVEERGWNRDRVITWLADTLAVLLLPPR